jgi:ribonuclease HI
LPDQPDVVVFTDGACRGNPGPGGWAAILKHLATGSVKRLSGGDRRTTNNKMELTAAIEGLRAISAAKRLRVHLVSDSQYVLYGLQEWVANWIRNDWRKGKSSGSPPVKNVELWKELYELSQAHDMSYEHVRGHTGHPENEECDRLAVSAIDELV